MPSAIAGLACVQVSPVGGTLDAGDRSTGDDMRKEPAVVTPAMRQLAERQRTGRPSYAGFVLDREREASMADEGGVSAALLDIEDVDERRARHPGNRRTRVPSSWLAVGAFGAGIIVGLGWWKLSV